MNRSNIIDKNSLVESVKSQQMDFVFLNIKRGVKKKVYINDIVCCQADNTYTIFHLVNDKKYIVSYSIGKIEKFLLQYDFFRVNRTYLINPTHIVLINNQIKPSLKLHNEMTLYVSKTKMKEIEWFLDEKYKCFTNL